MATKWILEIMMTSKDIIDASYRYLVVIFAGTAYATIISQGFSFILCYF